MLQLLPLLGMRLCYAAFYFTVSDKHLLSFHQAGSYHARFLRACANRSPTKFLHLYSLHSIKYQPHQIYQKNLPPKGWLVQRWPAKKEIVHHNLSANHFHCK